MSDEEWEVAVTEAEPALSRMAADERVQRERDSLIKSWADEAARWRALADDASDVFNEVWDQVPLGFSCMPKVHAWQARYREARGR